MDNSKKIGLSRIIALIDDIGVQHKFQGHHTYFNNQNAPVDSVISVVPLRQACELNIMWF